MSPAKEVLLAAATNYILSGELMNRSSHRARRFINLCISVVGSKRAITFMAVYKELE